MHEIERTAGGFIAGKICDNTQQNGRARLCRWSEYVMETGKIKLQPKVTRIKGSLMCKECLSLTRDSHFTFHLEGRCIFIGTSLHLRALGSVCTRFLLSVCFPPPPPPPPSPLEGGSGSCRPPSHSPALASETWERNWSLPTIRGYISAIASFHAGFPDGSTVPNTPFITWLMRSFFLKRPPSRSFGTLPS